MEAGQETDKACWQPDMQRVRTALEGIPLGQIRMKGVIGDKNMLWAIISTPEGKLEKKSEMDITSVLTMERFSMLAREVSRSKKFYLTVWGAG